MIMKWGLGVKCYVCVDGEMLGQCVAAKRKRRDLSRFSSNVD